MNEWWTVQSTGLICGIAGAACGTLGGLYGTVAGLLVPRGRGKPIVYGILALNVAIALGGVVLGIVGLLAGQPQHVWLWPLLIGGVILVAVLPTGLMMPAFYRQAEQRRLAAAEFRKSS